MNLNNLFVSPEDNKVITIIQTFSSRPCNDFTWLVRAKWEPVGWRFVCVQTASGSWGLKSVVLSWQYNVILLIIQTVASLHPSTRQLRGLIDHEGREEYPGWRGETERETVTDIFVVAERFPVKRQQKHLPGPGNGHIPIHSAMDASTRFPYKTLNWKIKQ